MDDFEPGFRSAPSQEAAGVDVLVDTGIYRLSAIKKAAYRFGDRLHVVMAFDGERSVRVTLKPRQADIQLDPVVGDFCNEVLDQELREVVAHETEAVRNLLLAQAFSRTSLIEEELECADYRDDPAGITRSRPPGTQSIADESLQ